MQEAKASLTRNCVRGAFFYPDIYSAGEITGGKQSMEYPSYDREHDACGIGAVVKIDGVPDHSVVDDALSIVEKLEHRAGKDASGKVGDGVGILLQISHAFFEKALKEERSQIALPDGGDYGVGMFFLPKDPLKQTFAKRLLEVIAAKEEMEVLGWRTVPICPSKY